MIDLKRNTKGELVPATGLNSQSWRIYKPNQEKDFPISRSRFEDFKKCHICFYLRLVRGFQEPDIPKFKLNELTDTVQQCLACISHQNKGEPNIEKVDLDFWLDPKSVIFMTSMTAPSSALGTSTTLMVPKI